VRFSPWRAFQGLNNDLLDLGIAYFAWRSGPGLVVESFQASFQKSPAPLAHHAQRAAQFPGDTLIALPLGTRQHDPSSPRQQGLAARTMR
jgi:hypothetical protein